MKKFIIFIFLVIVSIACREQKEQGSQKIVETILSDTSNYFYLDVKNYLPNDPNLPIGIFDSGTGGLTVLDAIVAFDRFDNRNRTPIATGDGLRDFQKEQFIYLGDQANMPYGNYAGEKNTELLKEHIIKDVQFLLGTRYYASPKDKKYTNDKQPVKAIVIACNTATAFGKDDIERFLKKANLGIKIIGVIDAGVRGALAELKKNEPATIAVMATAGTVSSNGYVNTINRLARESGFSDEVVTYQQAGIGLAGAIDGSADYYFAGATKPRQEYKGPSENNPQALIDTTILTRYGFSWSNGAMLFKGDANKQVNLQINSVENYIAYHVTSLLEKIRKQKSTTKLKSVILGCTHYPFYTDYFSEQVKRLYNYQENGKYVYRQFMSEDIVFIDPAINTALELYEHLNQQQIFNNSSLANSSFFISVPNPDNKQNILNQLGNFTYDYKYGRTAGDVQEYVKRVPIHKVNLDPEVISRLKEKIPDTFSLINGIQN